jgi:maltose O-acetyltransferase
VGDHVTIGRHCRIADGVRIFDAPGHPLDPLLRKEGRPANRDEVRPIVIKDNVWIGSRAVIMPGVSIGQDSVVAAGSVVMTAVPAGVLVAGNPARQIRVIGNVVSPPAPEKEELCSRQPMS